MEFAHFIGDDLLVIHGTFRPDISPGDAIPFVQMWQKRGEKWLLVSLKLFLTSEKGQ